LKPFVFCPACSAELGPRDEEGGATCPECGRVWYRNSSPTAGAVIVKGRQALITVRAREPEKGKIDVPGGFLHVGEHPVDGLKREVKEELGVEIEADVEDCLTMATHRYGEDGDFVLALGFRAALVSGEPQATDDVAAIRWVTDDELEVLDFAWPHDRELVRKALEKGEKQHG
jgi:ADP-ribose pyrophosphatase YjhB (NUDIX family)